MCDTYSPKYLGTILGIHRPFEVYPRLQVENCCFLEVLNITSAFIASGRERSHEKKSENKITEPVDSFVLKYANS